MKNNRKLKKKPHIPSKLILEEIIGSTTKNANGLASSISNSSFVYMAGCVVVVYNANSGTQLHLMVSNRLPKPLSCVAISMGGNLVAAGESGNQPAALVWDCESMASASELKGHQYGVTCMAFSPDGKHLVSVGFPHDGYLCLWDWRSKTLLTKLRACSSCSPAASVSFSADAKFIATAGKKHLKIWTVKSSTRSQAKTGMGSLTVHAKPVNLGHLKGCSFISVTSPILIGCSPVHCNRAGEFLPIYALTDSGVLCLLSSGLTVTNSVDLKVEKGFAISASRTLVACACDNGLVKLFTIDSLKYAGSLQHTEAKTCNKANDIGCHEKVCENEFLPLPKQPDAVACQFSTPEKLVVIYGDHSLYIWDIHDGYKATKCCVLVSHSACIWDIKNLSCENMHDPSLACVARGCTGGVSFATCSIDGTIRLWDLSLQPFLYEDSFSQTKGHSIAITEPVATTCLVSAGIFEHESVVSGVSTPGFRVMAVSSDGKHLAAGDWAGNLHIYNLQTSDYMCIKDAHNEEILSLSFSSPVKKSAFLEQVIESHYFLASGGKDRKIHLYDVERNFALIGTVEDHSAPVISVKLSANGCKILSCRADASLVFYEVAAAENACNISRCYHQLTTQGTIYGMAVDPTMEAGVTVGQDKKVNIFNVAAGKLIRSFKQDGDLKDPIRVCMDPSSSYMVCSYSNKTICMYDFMTGEMVARAVGHGEVTTGVIFLPDCKHLVSVGRDGCIFVWKVPTPLSSRMLQKIKENCCPLSPNIMVQPAAVCQIKFHEEDDHLCKTNPNNADVVENSNQVSRRRLCCQGGGLQETSTFKFSISRLPKWAQAKVTTSKVIPADPEFTSSQPARLQSFLHLDVDPESHTTPSKNDSEGSKQFCGTMSRSAVHRENSQSSPMTQEICRTFALDKRWHTIHTVCLDLLNSPEVWEMKGMKVPLSFSNMCKGKRSQDTSEEARSDSKCIKLLSVDPSENISSVEPTVPFVNCVDGQGADLTDCTRLNNNSVLLCNGNDQLRIINTHECHEEVRELSEEMQSETYESRSQTTMDIFSSNMKSQENDMLDLDLDNSSAQLKIEGRKSLARKSYSARFVVRQDPPMDHNELFDTPVRHSVGESMNCKMVALQRTNTCNEGKKKTHKFSPSESTGSSSATNKVENSEVINARGQEECDVEETFIACREALLNLDAATESALGIFSKLGKKLVSREEVSRGAEARLYAEASAMLPSIARKVQAVAKLAQYNLNNPGGEMGVDLSGFEPLLGTFAESLSQKVVEIVKKNFSTL
ncbi:hypothetical protein LguiB_035369 [Lonicera macranthoides]